MLQLPEVFQWGPFTVPVNIAILGTFALLVGVTLVWKYKSEFPMVVWYDNLFSGIVAFVLAWKLTYIVTGFQSFVQNPISILYGSGGLFGLITGSFTGIIVIYRGLRKGNMVLPLWLDLTALWLLFTLTLYWLIVPSYGLSTEMPWGMRAAQSELLYHPLNLYRFSVALFVILILWRRKRQLGTGDNAGKSAISMGIGLFIVSLFSYHPFVYFGLSGEQWLMVAISVMGFVGMARKGSERNAT